MKFASIKNASYFNLCFHNGSEKDIICILLVLLHILSSDFCSTSFPEIIDKACEPNHYHTPISRYIRSKLIISSFENIINSTFQIENFLHIVGIVTKGALISTIIVFGHWFINFEEMISFYIYMIMIFVIIFCN